MFCHPIANPNSSNLKFGRESHVNSKNKPAKPHGNNKGTESDKAAIHVALFANKTQPQSAEPHQVNFLKPKRFFVPLEDLFTSKIPEGNKNSPVLLKERAATLYPKNRNPIKIFKIENTRSSSRRTLMLDAL